VVVSVFFERADDRAFTQQGFYDQLIAWIAIVAVVNVLPLLHLVNFRNATDIKRRMRPGTLGDILDDVTDPCASFNKDDISGADLVA
jgi:hypothetical protein